MKMVVLWAFGLILLLIIVQVAYSAFYFRKSAELVKNDHIGRHEFGDKKKEGFKLFFGGDSVGAGVGATKLETSVAGRVAEHLARDKFVVLDNQSVSGTKMRDLATRKLPEGKWDVAVLIVSSNDLFRFSNLDEFKKSTEKVLESYSKISDKVIIVGPGRVFDSPAVPVIVRPIYRWRAGAYIRIMDEEIKKHDNAVHINPVEPPKGISQVANWESPDKFHPGDEGQKFWFEMIKTEL